MSVLGQGAYSTMLILIFYNFFNMIPKSLDEAAMIDGAGSLKVFYIWTLQRLLLLKLLSGRLQVMQKTIKARQKQEKKLKKLEKQQKKRLAAQKRHQKKEAKLYGK